MGIDNFSFFGGHTFAESFQARDGPFKQPHDFRPTRLEYPVDKKDHLGYMFVSES